MRGSLPALKPCRPIAVQKDPLEDLAAIFARLGRDYGGALPADFVLPEAGQHEVDRRPKGNCWPAARALGVTVTVHKIIVSDDPGDDLSSTRNMIASMH